MFSGREGGIHYKDHFLPETQQKKERAKDGAELNQLFGRPPPRPDLTGPPFGNPTGRRVSTTRTASLYLIEKVSSPVVVALPCKCPELFRWARSHINNLRLLSHVILNIAYLYLLHIYLT